MGKAATPIEIPEGVTITLQWQCRKCGKQVCSVCRNGQGHGPYYYAFWHEACERSKFGQRSTQGKLHSRYFGPIYPELAGVEDQIEPEEAYVV